MRRASRAWSLWAYESVAEDVWARFWRSDCGRADSSWERRPGGREAKKLSLGWGSECESLEAMVVCLEKELPTS